MARIIVRHPGVPSREPIDLGPSVGRIWNAVAARRPIDVALSQAPRKEDVVIWDSRR